MTPLKVYRKDLARLRRHAEKIGVAPGKALTAILDACELSETERLQRAASATSASAAKPSATATSPSQSDRRAAMRQGRAKEPKVSEKAKQPDKRPVLDLFSQEDE